MEVVDETPQVERKLVAILAADVVGYSRLMSLDETGTLTRLKALRRDVVDPVIANHHGRIVKLMGDGALVEFASVVDAVACAVEIQRAIATQRESLPEHARISLRIGINLGDVIVDGDDVYGDGVNVAARLEGLCEPDGIMISGTAYDHARNKLDVAFQSLGRQHLKNIPEPVRVYRVLLKLPARRRRRRPRWSTLAAALVLLAIVAAIGVAFPGPGPPPCCRTSCARPDWGRASPRSSSSRSTVPATMPSRTISPTGSPTISSPTCRRSQG